MRSRDRRNRRVGKWRTNLEPDPARQSQTLPLISLGETTARGEVDGREDERDSNESAEVAVGPLHVKDELELGKGDLSVEAEGGG